LKIRNEKDFPRDYVDTLYNLTVAYDNDFLKDWQNAYQTCAKAIEVLETRIRAVSSAETRRALAENQAKIYHRMVSMCIRLGKPDEAVSFAERGKSRTLVEMIHAAQLQPSETVPKDIREAFIAVRDKLDELRNRQQMGEKETPRDFEIIKDDGERGIKFRSFPVDYTSRREEIWKLIDDAYNAYNLLLEQVRKVDPVFASLEKVQPISVSEINTMIPEKTVFIECFTGFDGTYVFVLDGKSNVRDNYIVLKGLTSDELFNNLATENWLRPYYTYLQDRTSENRKAWHNTIENTPKLLAEKFWYAKDEKSRSLSSLVEQSGAERVVFIPHSGLHLLPLHLIPLESGKRLFDKYEIAYAPSASMLRFKLNPSHYKKPYHYKKPSRYEALPRNENQDGSAVIPREAEPHSMRYEAEPRNEISIPRNEKRLFAVADPDCSLAFTDSEVQAIAKHFENPHILWHENASKEAVFSDAGTGNIVHFSCHGSFQYANPLDSKLILAGGDKDDKKNLTLKEIFANLKIPNADAVVLSACETGMVQLERGDEYVGIASGFMYAGANSVISSLWAVDDFSTSLLMQKFYDNILNKKMGKAEALKESQQYVRKIENKDILPLLAQLKEKSGTLTFKALHRRYEKLKGDERPFEHPYYWGAFVCTGIWY